MSHYSVFVGTQANPEPRSSRVFQSIDDAIAEYNRAVVAPSVIYAELVRFSDTDANGVTLQSWGRNETTGVRDE